MATPIAALYSRPRSPYLAPPPPTSPPRPPTDSSSAGNLPTPPRPGERTSPIKRATLSLDPRRDDPFAAHSPAQDGEDDPAGEDLGGEEWAVDSSLDRARQTGPQEPGPAARPRPAAAAEQAPLDASVRRRSSTSSFFRSLVRRPSRTTSTASTTTAPSPSPAAAPAKAPRRARSSVQLERISAPLAGSARGGSLRVRGTVELIGVHEAVERRRSWVAQEQGEGNGGQGGPGAEEKAQPQPQPLRTSESARSLGRRGSLGKLFWRSAGGEAKEADSAQQDDGERPPTQSHKALKVLGGIVGSSKGDDYPADLDERDVVGLALTTDEPTRRIVPDNARYSFATLSSSVGSMRSRALASTASSVRSPSIRRIRVGSSGTTLSRHAEESAHNVPGPAASRPPSAPPTAPLPALPAASASTTSLPRFNVTAPTPGTTPASHRTRIDSRPPLPPGLAPEPEPAAPGSPPSPLPQRHSAAAAPQAVRRMTSRASTLRREQQQHGAPPHEEARAPDEAQRPARPPRSSARTARSVEGSATQASPHLRFDDSGARTARSRTAAGVSGSGDRASRGPVSSADVRRSALRNGGSSASTTSMLQQAPPVRDPLASLYLVCGLGKEPRTWTEADRVEGAGEGRQGARRWKAEVLGVMEGSRKEGDGQDEELVRRLERDEKERVQAKALKLAFDRDVEIMISPQQPPATTSFFSFTTLRPSSSASSIAPVEQRYHCVSLVVWARPDPASAAAISALLHERPQRATMAQVEAETIRRAAKAARAGKRLSSQLLERMRGEKEDEADGERTASGAASESETEGRPSLDLEDAPAMPSPFPFDDDFDHDPLWLPYAIVLISTSPLYAFLSDVVRLSWARYHQDLTAHSLQMERLLKTPTLAPGDKIRIPFGVEQEQRETFFVTTMPGKIDWSTAVAASNYPLWPIFKALHADNLLTVAELALAPLGRIVFVNRHQIMLSLATMTYQKILDMRGWKGLAFPTVHARDVKLFLEDPGPWLLGLLMSPSTSIFLDSLSPDIVLVDLDANLVSCSRPFPGAVSTGATRDKARKKLELALGNVGRNEVPLELVEAFPRGRFRPFSVVEVEGEEREAERLKPHGSWRWDESLVLKEVDAILADTPRVTVLGRILGRKALPRKNVKLDSNLKQVQAVVREHTATFVEQRDVLEAEVHKVNRRLHVLMSQSVEWSRSFATFKEFSERATIESAELKMRLERERREARRLTSQLAADRDHQAQLEDSLEAVEQAREQALAELARVDAMRRDLEHHRELVAQEIEAIMHGADDESSPVYRAVYSQLEAISHRSDTPSLRSSSAMSNRSPSRLACRPSNLGDRHPSVIEEEDEEAAAGDARDVLEEEARLESMRLALQETLRAVSSRLSLALQRASVLGEASRATGGSSSSSSPIDTSSPSRSAESDATLVSSAASPTAVRPPTSPDVGPFDKPQSFAPTGASALGFYPKALTLTPPVSPELSTEHVVGTTISASPYVTMRPQSQPRYRARAHGHVKEDSAGGSSFMSCSSGTSASMTPPARSAVQSFAAYSTPTSAIYGHGRSASQATGTSRAPIYPRSASATSLSRSHSQTPSQAYSRSPSALSQLSYISSPSPGAASETDDAQSFVSVSDGGADESLASLDGSMRGSGGFELEELAAHAVSPTPHGRSKVGGGAHRRQDSFAIDAPPVAFFTRSSSLRSVGGRGAGAGASPTGGGGARAEAADEIGRVRAVVRRYEQRA
ncbi:hypothetical protein JCM9279_004298 [Rhodotorula babjevae]